MGKNLVLGSAERYASFVSTSYGAASIGVGKGIGVVASVAVFYNRLVDCMAAPVKMRQDRQHAMAVRYTTSACRGQTPSGVLAIPPDADAAGPALRAFSIISIFSIDK